MWSVSRLLWSHANTRGVLRVQDPVPCEPQVKAIAAARCSELYAILTYSRCSLSPLATKSQRPWSRLHRRHPQGQGFAGKERPGWS